MSMKPCIEPGCGEPSDETRCEDHRIDHRVAKDERRGSAQSRGYDAAWQRLSKRARKMQPFCLDCGTTANLSADHKPEAWQRVAEGKPLRLTDVEVVCSDCNARRGSSRPGSRRALEAATSRGDDPSSTVCLPPGKARSQLVLGIIVNKGGESL